jgi:uncharacterized protein (DUF305 family)
MSLPFRWRVAVAAAIALAATAASSGVARSEAPAATANAAANATDRAFVRTMVPHHQMANEMARMARENGEHRRIRTLARRIIRAQSAEIRTLRRIARDLGVTPSEMAHHEMSEQMMRDLETLGLTEEESAMTMNMDELEGADPFDRTFIDMMIPHHQGAIRMARAELAEGTDRRLRRIARAIISDQGSEIRRMNAWRTEWYGAASPAGGVPQP